MKIGFVLECTPKGPEQQVFEAFVRRLQAEGEIDAVECVYRCMVNKALLFVGAAEAVSNLLQEDSCDHVFVIWDARPPWEPVATAIDCAAEYADMQAKLTAAGLPLARISSVCIQYEIETWLISDAKAFFEFPHAKKIPASRKPMLQASPKDAASKMKEEIGLGRYLDFNDAKILADHVRFRELAKIASFCLWFCKMFTLAPARPKASYCSCE